MELSEIVQKLVGNVRGCGESNEDGKRLENIKVLIQLADEITDRLIVIAADQFTYESSVKKIGLEADKFITNLREKLQL